MKLEFQGLLFDLDGTLIDSSEVIDRAWAAFANKHSLDREKVMHVIHGKPAGESIKALCPDATANDIANDTRWLEQMESEDTEGVIALAGSIEFLNTLNDNHVPWAIVTSGTIPVATARITAAGLPKPSILITPELVSQGKPDPEPYLLGAKQLGLDATECVVFEDAVAGVRSGVAAGAKVIGILTLFDRDELLAANATECVANLASVHLSVSSREKSLSTVTQIA